MSEAKTTIKEINEILIDQTLNQSTSSSFINSSLFIFSWNIQHPSFGTASVEIPAHIIDQVYEAAAQEQQQRAQPIGFQREQVPLSYIKQNYHQTLIEHVKEFLFKFCVINYLYEQLYLHKVPLAGDARLTNIHLNTNESGKFNFELTLIPPFIMHDWKYFPFKAPRRKNYKDLDRQVEYFMEEELELKNKYEQPTIELYDWVNFSIVPVNKNKEPLCASLLQDFWIKTGDDDIESALKNLFLGKKLKESFYTTDQGLQDYFSDSLNGYYVFKVDIQDIVPHAYFCFEQFKNYFRLKTNKELHKKCIEVFSYRNHISQRRAMVEEALALLVSKHQFEVPNHLVLRQQNIILTSIRENPDYNVYRKQDDFQLRVEQLAYKQAKETIMIDHIAYADNLQVNNVDIKGYLNLTQRNRMKEFLYFSIPETKRNGQEIPIATEQLKKSCLREKTINHIIYHLTKK